MCRSFVLWGRTGHRSGAEASPAPEYLSGGALLLRQGSAPDAGDEKDPPPLVVSLLGLIAAVMAGISVFYSIVFYAGGGIAYLVKDTITFTRKDFIPYSERRRLEAEAEEAQRSRDEAAGAGAAPDVRFSETLLPSSGKK